MPMLIVDDESFAIEQAKLNREPPGAIFIPKKHGGRRNGDTDVPMPLRKVIAEEAVNGTNSNELAKVFGISHDSISAYKHGATSCATYNKPNQELQLFVDKTTEKINVRAKNRILMALKHITEEKLKEAKPRDLAAIASDMAKVVEKTAPRVRENVSNTIVFYSPTQNKEESYDSIAV
jgi:hypothetical protein